MNVQVSNLTCAAKEIEAPNITTQMFEAFPTDGPLRQDVSSYLPVFFRLFIF